MKKSSLLLAMMLSVGLSSAFASDLTASQVPEAVKQSFVTRFPAASVIEWDFDEDDNLFEVDAKISQLEVEAMIDKDGKVIRTKEDVRAEDIPASVVEKVHQEWPRAEILGANKLTDAQKGVTWDVGLKVRSRYRNIQIAE